MAVFGDPGVGHGGMVAMPGAGSAVMGLQSRVKFGAGRDQLVERAAHAVEGQRDSPDHWSKSRVPRRVIRRPAVRIIAMRSGRWPVTDR
jgi:hypothetical protein